LSATARHGAARKYTSRGSAYSSVLRTRRSICATRPAIVVSGQSRPAQSISSVYFQNRDQLFAEAVNLFRAGVAWWPNPQFEREHIMPEQEARYELDAWEQPIARYLAILHPPKKTTLLEVAVEALGFEIEPPMSKDTPRGTPINRLTPGDQRRIAAVLTHLKWEPKRNKQERWWQPVTPE
jgi:predicted P-loop ATPase